MKVKAEGGWSDYGTKRLPYVNISDRVAAMKHVINVADVPKFVISMRPKGARTARIAQRFAEFGGAFQNSCRVQAVIGKECPLEKAWRHAQASAGCFLSHMKVWRHIVDNRIPVAIVMEDDALGQTHPNFLEYLQEVVNLHEEFDVFRLHLQYRKEAKVRGKFKDVVTVSDEHLLQHEHYIEKENSYDQCRKPTSCAMYVMTLAGAEFHLKNLHFGGTCDGRLKHIDYYTSAPVEAYANSSEMRVRELIYSGSTCIII